MALIEYLINRDENGTVTIVPTIHRLDPGDEVHLITSTPDAALQWNAESPFLPPGDAKVHLLGQTNAVTQPLHPSKPIDLSEALAVCGKADSNGVFVPWLQGPGFPNASGTKVQGN